MSLLLKYCGNRSFEDYQLVRESAATHIGFIFVESSKRFVRPEEVKEWLQTLPPKPHQKVVGIFVNPSVENLKKQISLVPLDVLQLHGDEDQGIIEDVRSFFSGEVWKVIHHSEEAVHSMKTYEGLVDAFLVDTKVVGAWGGTGQAFNWLFVPQYINEARRLGVPCVIAGGVHSDNVEELINFKPDGIDLASGIEAFDKKSQERIQALERKVVSK